MKMKMIVKKKIVRIRKNKVNSLNFKKHLTTGFNNANNNLKENKNSLSSFTKQKTAKTAQDNNS